MRFGARCLPCPPLGGRTCAFTAERASGPALRPARQHHPMHLGAVGLKHFLFAANFQDGYFYDLLRTRSCGSVYRATSLWELFPVPSLSFAFHPAHSQITLSRGDLCEVPAQL